MAREPSSSVSTKHPALDELKTIQLLEETVGPKGLRQLRGAMDDESSRRILENVTRASLDDLRELDDLLHEWVRHERPHAPERRLVAEELDVSEVLSSVVELKESEAQMMRRAAETAPTERLRERLLALAARQEAAAEKLKSLL